MSIGDATRLVAMRELRERARRRSTWIIAAVLLLGSLAAAIVPELVHSNAPTRYTVALVGDPAALRDTLVALGPPLEATIDVQTVADADAARQLVTDKKVDIGLVPAPGPAVIVRAGTNDRLVGAARQALATAALADTLHVDTAEVDRITAAAVPELRKVDANADSRRGAAFGVSLILYLLLLSLMVQVSNGVAIEKANRISEVLLPIVRPGALLFGKVIGVGIGGTFFLAVGMLPIVVKLAAGGNLPDGLGGALVGGAAWFVLGLALYLTVAGALGALVERPEDAGSSITPLSLVLVATFFVAQTAPDSPVGTALAYVPFTAPLLVPTRIAVGASSPLELVLSLALLVATVAVVGIAAARIYARAVVRTGAKVRLRDVVGAGPTQDASASASRRA